MAIRSVFLLLHLGFDAGKLLQRGHRPITDLRVHLGLHLRLRLHFSSSECLSGIFATEGRLFHLFVKCDPDEVLVLAEGFFRKYKQPQLRVGLQHQLPVQLECRYRNLVIIPFLL